MVEEVGRLAGEARAVLGGRGDHRLDRLLAQLLREPRDPFAQQARGVGSFRPLARPARDGAGEPNERAAGRLAEARRGAGVAGRPGLAHHVEHRVAVAVDAHLGHGLRVPGRLPLLPEAGPAAAVVMRLAGIARALQRRPVGVCDHQDLAGEGALSDDGDESIVPEAHVLDPVVGGHVGKISAHLRIVKMPCGNNFSPMRWFASVFTLGLMMALFHRLTAGGALDAPAPLALGFLLLAAQLGGDMARRARLPRVTGYLLAGLPGGPAWLGLVPAGGGGAPPVLPGAGVAPVRVAAGGA